MASSAVRFASWALYSSRMACSRKGLRGSLSSKAMVLQREVLGWPAASTATRGASATQTSAPSSSCSPRSASGWKKDVSLVVMLLGISAVPAACACRDSRMRSDPLGLSLL